VYRLLAAWSEIVEKVAAGRPSLHGFLDTAKAYRSSDGKSYLVCASSSFCAKMLSRPDTVEALKLAIAEEEGRDISACAFAIEGNTADQKYTLVDEIAEALGS
jgi:hypothetical protein